MRVRYTCDGVCAREQIFYVNHSVNFFLYCITGRRFREALRSALCCPQVETFDAAGRIGPSAAIGVQNVGNHCPEVESFDAARRRIADSPCLVAAAVNSSL